MLNDAHCHFFSRRFFETLARERKDLRAKDKATAVAQLLEWEPPGSPEQLADQWNVELERHGVSRAALIASVPGDEESVAAAIERHPGRYVGFFMLDPTARDAPQRVRRALHTLGLRGLCLFPAMHRYRLDDARVRRVLDIAAGEPRAVVFVHCGFLSVGVRKKLGLPSAFDFRLGDPLTLRAVLAAYPQMPVIVPHFGAGFFREALMAADACPNIHFDTSSSNGWVKYVPGLTLAAVFRQALEIVGPDRLIFGTDSSFFPRGWQRPVWEAQRAALVEASADTNTMTKIFSENFDRLFPTLQSAPEAL